MPALPRPLVAPFIKICCIRDRAEGELALAHGADAIGLVSAMPSGPGPISEGEIRSIVRALPSETTTFLLTSLREARPIVEQHARCGTRVLQLVDALPEKELRALRIALPEVVLVQVIHVTGEESVRQAEEVAPLVDAILLDSGRPKAAVKELGGTGRVHDWSLSARIRQRIGVPLLLAGGLRPENVALAWRSARPFGLDVCSGVRSDGRLDAAKLRAFVSAARGR